MRARSLFCLILLIAAAALVGCGGGDPIDFDLHVQADGSTKPSFVWTSEAAREVDVYRCKDVCPDASSLPTENGPVERSDLSQVAKFYAVDGVESGRGAILSPVTVGSTPKGANGVQVDTGDAPSELTAGNYVVRVVLAHGSLVSADWGIRWAPFHVDGT